MARTNWRELEWKVCYEEVCFILIDECVGYEEVCFILIDECMGYEEVCFILIDECVGYGGLAQWVGTGATGCLADDI